MSQEEPDTKHHPTHGPSSPGLWLPNLALSPPPCSPIHRADLPGSLRCLLPSPCLAGSQSSCATTEKVIRPLLNPLQAAAIDVPHKCILLHLPKTYRSYKRGKHPSIAPKMTFAPFPKKLQHKLGQRWAAKGSSFVPVPLEEKNNCCFPSASRNNRCSAMPRGLAPLCTSLWTAMICCSPSQCFFIMACIKRAPLFRICSLFHIGKGK